MNDDEFDLHQSRESLDFALKSGRMCTWDINLETGSIYCSQDMLELWGVSPQEFKNQRAILQSKVHPEDLQMMNDAINKAIETKTIYELEYRIIPSPGTVRWVLSRGRCTFKASSDVPSRFAGIVYDVTEKKEREKKLDSALRARSDFLTTASHELKTPLTCMQLQLQVLQWHLKQTEEKVSLSFIEDGLKKQQNQLLRIARLVDNILDESRVSEGKLQLSLETFDLCEMVKEVIEQFRPAAELSDVEVEFLSSQSVTGSWDRFHLEQVLMNLLMNAIRYGNKKPVTVEVAREENLALIRVMDQGVGIKAEDHQRVFERFERVSQNKNVNGMGLGLHISRSIVNAHGGEIRLRSELSKGSVFTVVLPCAPQAVGP